MGKSLYIILLLTFVFGRYGHSQSILSDSVQLSEVVVTAEKRNQKIRDLPTSVTSISISRIESEKAKSLRNISAIVPNFYMPEYGSKLTAPVYIRGVGSRINSPSVGLYVDRVPYFEKSAFAFDFADVERIEVLRGPQGTLYGRNTMGGIINIITRAPRNYRELKLSTDFGNHGFMKYNFSYNEPLTAKLAVLLNGGYTEHDGYFTNNYHDENVGSDFTKNASVKIRYNPVKYLVLTYKLGGERSYEKGYPYGILDSTNTVKEINYNFKSRYHRDIIDNSLTASLYLDKFVVTSVSGMQYLKDNQAIDQDFMPKDYYQVHQGVEQNQYTQEIVLTTNQNNLVDATIGVFGFFQKADRTIDLDYSADIAELRIRKPGGGIITSGNGYIKYNNEENSGAAAFGQATIKKIAGLLDLSFGLRYDYEMNSLHYSHFETNAEVKAIKRDTIFKESFGELLPKFSVRFYLPGNTSAYFTTSKGYRGGGFNTAFVRDEDQQYTAEDSWNYELGVKSNPFSFLSLSAAIFYIDWNNQQVSQRVPVGGNMIKNAGKSFSKGLEFEFAMNPLKNLQLGANFGFTEARYLDFKPNLSDTVNLKNKYLPFIPRYTFSAFAAYKIMLKHEYLKSAFVNLSSQGIGKQFWNDVNDKSQGSYSVVNGSVGLETKWFEVSLWAKNLLNKTYFPYMFYVTNFNNWYAQKGQPITFGVTLAVNIAQKN